MSQFKRITSAFAFVLLSSFVMSANVATAAGPTTADLEFTYNIDSGLIRVLHTFDRAPAKVCRVTFRGLISYEGLNTEAALRSVKTRKVSSGRTLRLRAYNLPGVRLDSEGRAPILTMQARAKCGNRTIVSNAFARYVKCGKGSLGVGPTKFLKLVANSIN
jgi:hypothetical protein